VKWIKKEQKNEMKRKRKDDIMQPILVRNYEVVKTPSQA